MLMMWRQLLLLQSLHPFLMTYHFIALKRTLPVLPLSLPFFSCHLWIHIHTFCSRRGGREWRRGAYERRHDHNSTHSGEVTWLWWVWNFCVCLFCLATCHESLNKEFLLIIISGMNCNKNAQVRSHLVDRLDDEGEWIKDEERGRRRISN